jgi:hypothetical protein
VTGGRPSAELENQVRLGLADFVWNLSTVWTDSFEVGSDCAQVAGKPEVMRLSIAVPGERLVDFQLDRNTVAFVYNGTDRIERELRNSGDCLPSKAVTLRGKEDNSSRPRVES